MKRRVQKEINMYAPLRDASIYRLNHRVVTDLHYAFHEPATLTMTDGTKIMVLGHVMCHYKSCLVNELSGR